MTPEEYIKSFDELYSYFCDNLELAKENIKKEKGNELIQNSILVVFQKLRGIFI